MFQAIFAALLISLIILPIPLLVIAQKRHQRKALRSLLDEFSRVGSQNGLSFSSQEVLRHSVIGLDGLQRKLLVVEREGEDRHQSVVIDLNDMKRCVVNKGYQRISRGDSAKPEELLQSISLKFDVPHLAAPNIVFYNRIDDPAGSASELESKANHWQVMLTKLQTPLQKTA